MKLRRIAAVLLIVCMALMMFACSSQGSGDETMPDVTSGSAETELPVATYVGSHATSNAMGDVVSGHLINVFADGSVKIYYGIKAGASLRRL